MSTKNYWYYREKGICVDCKTQKAVEGKTRCDKCRIKHQEYHNDTFMKIKRKTKYNELKEKGICVDCKKSKAEKGIVRCKSCMLIMKAKTKTSYKELKEKGLCIDCKKAIQEEGMARCKSCRTKRNKYRNEYNKKLISQESMQKQVSG